MSVLEGEGTTLILYGTIDIPLGARSWSGYLARPDGVGEWPTVVVVPGAWGLSGSVKDLCRRMARHGIAAIAADPLRGKHLAPRTPPEEADDVLAAIPPSRVRDDIGAFARFVVNPSADWSNAEHGYGVVGLDVGASWAARHVASHPLAISLGVIDPPLGLLPDVVGDIAVPILGTARRSESSEWNDEFEAVREAAGQAEWALYGDVGPGFWDIGRDDYDHVAATDTFDRLVGFFGRTLPPKR